MDFTFLMSVISILPHDSTTSRMHRKGEQLRNQTSLRRPNPMNLDDDPFWVRRHTSNRAIAWIPGNVWPTNGIRTLHEVDKTQLRVPFALARPALWMLHEK